MRKIFAILYLIAVALSLFGVAVNHGEPTGATFNIWRSLFHEAVMFALLYLVGFFKGLDNKQQ